MGIQPVRCTKCEGGLPPDMVLGAQQAPGTCPHCNCEIQVHSFPALLEPLGRGREAEALVLDSDASCFYHASKSAETVCDGCGRFLCTLCDLPVGDQHLCPTCLRNTREDLTEPMLLRERPLYDNIAFAFAVYPILIAWLTIVTAPIVLFLIIRHRRAPASLVGGFRWRAWIAGVLALLQIGGWIALLVFIIIKVT